MVHEVHTECSQLKNEFSIVGVGTAVLPRPVVMHVPEVDDIPAWGGGGMEGCLSKTNFRNQFLKTS